MTITPGKFVLHSNAIPDLPAGPYVVEVRQHIHSDTQTVNPGGALDVDIDPLDYHIEVTAPRFLLPPDQVLSTFPPNASQGAFSSRLPQIVLKRRTLPWERELDGKAVSMDPNSAQRLVPWMALVLLADGECTFESGKPVAECVTPGVVLEGRNDVDRGDRIIVTQDVVDEVFPSQAELPLLAHVREVDLADTELALGDDDGWMAVVIGNRLPQPGVRYRACLISVEGQYDKLRTHEALFDDQFDKIYVYPDVIAHIDQLSYAGHYPDVAYQSDVPAWLGISASDAMPGVASVVEAAVVERGVTAVRAFTSVDAWSNPHTQPVNPSSGTTATATYTAHLVGAMHNIDLSIIAPLIAKYTFPVLAHWEFTCVGAGDFQSLMQGLDVGMIGTLPDIAPTKPGEKAPPPATRKPPEVLDTGHISLDHVTREGEPTTVWYRGPLVPRPTVRQEPEAGKPLPLAHTSDQLRRVGPDGRENLGAATGFEIGRLLALAEPSVVAALLTWRKDGFDESHRATMAAGHTGLNHLGFDDVTRGFAARVSHDVIANLGSNGAARLGRTRPLIEPGVPIEGIDDNDPIELLATGFGLRPEMVKDLIFPEARRRLGSVEVPVARNDDQFRDLAEKAQDLLGPLRQAVLEAATDVARAAFSRGIGRHPGLLPGSVLPDPAPPGSVLPQDPGGTVEPDALDILLREGN